MVKTETNPPTYRSRPMRTGDAHWGRLRTSDDKQESPALLRKRMEEDGYLYLPGLLPREVVLEAGNEIKRRLSSLGALDPTRPVEEGVAMPGVHRAEAHELAVDNAPVDRAIYGPEMLGFFFDFLGGKVRHFDRTWLRAKAPADDNAAHPHYDVVFMGRGTRQLFTAWTPMTDVPVEMGGLIVLENSHKNEDLIRGYGSLDVDVYCTNEPDAVEIESGEKRWQERVKDGAYSDDIFAVQDELGGRWLGGDFRAGDVLVFSMHLMHASMDNQTNRFRISTDSRYQLASEPADPRWVGEKPVGHGPGGKKGMIC